MGGGCYPVESIAFGHERDTHANGRHAPQGHIEDRWRSNMNRGPLPHGRSNVSAFTALAVLAVAGLAISLTSPIQASTINNLIQNPDFTATAAAQNGNMT